jgi:hypothetical protein
MGFSGCLTRTADRAPDLADKKSFVATLSRVNGWQFSIFARQYRVDHSVVEFAIWALLQVICDAVLDAQRPFGLCFVVSRDDDDQDREGTHESIAERGGMTGLNSHPLHGG